MEFPTIDKFAKDVAEKALDEIIYEGKTIREWVEILAKQQPCEDCVSREAIKEKKVYSEERHEYVVPVAEIDWLPSVQPQSLEQIKWERDTAIEQLEQLGYGLGEKVEPWDCVSRTKVAEILKNNESYFDEVWYCIDLINKVDDLPPVTPQQKWILCSERLPEEDGEYFVSVRYKYVKGYESVCTEYGEWNDGSWIYDPEYCGEAEGIIAWMPLPEPYKEESNGE